jgi:hypothetical protein
MCIFLLSFGELFSYMHTLLIKYHFELFYRVAKETIKVKERGTKTNNL